jgi:hypothetical protein
VASGQWLVISWQLKNENVYSVPGFHGFRVSKFAFGEFGQLSLISVQSFAFRVSGLSYRVLRQFAVLQL